MSGLISRLIGWWRRLWRRPVPRYALAFVEADELPDSLPDLTLLVAREGETLWAAGMNCPCGCQKKLEMMLLPEVTPRWDLSEDREGPSLHPSVWANSGCRSHFWLKGGVVHWCRD